jgi:hypothetical protein
MARFISPSFFKDLTLSPLELTCLACCTPSGAGARMSGLVGFQHGCRL